MNPRLFATFLFLIGCGLALVPVSSWAAPDAPVPVAEMKNVPLRVFLDAPPQAGPDYYQSRDLRVPIDQATDVPLDVFLDAPEDAGPAFFKKHSRTGQVDAVNDVPLWVYLEAPEDAGPEWFKDGVPVNHVKGVPLRVYLEAPGVAGPEYFTKLLGHEIPNEKPLTEDASLPLPTLTAEVKTQDGEHLALLSFQWLAKTKPASVKRVELWRKVGATGTFEHRSVLDGDGEDVQTDPLAADQAVWYRARVIGAEGYRDGPDVGPVLAQSSLFNWPILNLFLAMLVFCGLILYFYKRSKGGTNLFIRRIDGLDALERAVGRAAEMDRKILFVPGIQDVDDPQTIAGLNILHHVAFLAAKIRAALDVPVARGMVLLAGREVVDSAYLAAGRPAEHKPETVHYLTDDQFGYTAGVDGLIVREKPAAIFFQGTFFAEALVMAETGKQSGAMQIGGTAMVNQLPFFITTCDYTLIGEELYAASAYVSRDPGLVGALKGQDMGKLLALAFLLGGTLLATLFSLFNVPAGIAFVQGLLRVAG